MFPKGSHERSFEPRVDGIRLIERHSQNDFHVRFLTPEEYDSDIGLIVRMDLAISRRLINKWWLGVEIARTYEPYIVIRRRLGDDLTRYIWVEFLVVPFTDCESRRIK